MVKKSGESGESGEIEKWRNFLAKVEKFIYRICWTVDRTLSGTMMVKLQLKLKTLIPGWTSSRWG
jgi:hypothetical protein